MKKAILVRHGDIAADTNRYWGHTDVALSAAGIAQARCLQGRLVGETIDVAYSSDLRRAVDTAAIITRVPVLRCPELREIGFGQCEGLTFAEMTTRFPATCRIWSPNEQQAAFPDGESLATLASRVRRFLQRLYRHEGQTALVVAHGGSLRVLVCCLTGQDLAAWRDIRIDRASLSVIELEGDGGKATVLNDLSHLGLEGHAR